MEGVTGGTPATLCKCISVQRVRICAARTRTAVPHPTRPDPAASPRPHSARPVLSPLPFTYYFSVPSMRAATRAEPRTLMLPAHAHCKLTSCGQWQLAYPFRVPNNY